MDHDQAVMAQFRGTGHVRSVGRGRGNRRVGPPVRARRRQLWRVVGHFRHRIGNYDGARDAFETASLLVPLDAPTRRVLADASPGPATLSLQAPSIGAWPPIRLARATCFPPSRPGSARSGNSAGHGGLPGDGPTRSGIPEAHFGVAYYLRRLGRSAEVVLPIVARAHELSPEVPLLPGLARDAARSRRPAQRRLANSSATSISIPFLAGAASGG